MYWSRSWRLGSSSSQPSSKNSNLIKPSPKGAGSSVILLAFLICMPVVSGVEKVTNKPFDARHLPSLRSGFTWPWPGNETRTT
uniref:Glycosyltransferase n=1 Tax=Rhizophora mucronata TaxID=61149 RepID=A0A2P2NMH9_RHIMU